MNVSFDTEIAKEYGVLEAVMLQDIYYWVGGNEEKGFNFYDGKYWTYNTIKEFQFKYQFPSEKQIRTALKHLQDAGLIETGDFSSNRFKRPTYYTITEKGVAVLNHTEVTTCCPTGQNESDQRDTTCSTERAIDNIYINNNITSLTNQTNKSNTNQYSSNDSFAEEFEIIWKKYPNKRGKQKALNSYIKARKDGVAYEKISQGLDNYNEWLKAMNKSLQYTMNGSTWFGGHCWDDEYQVDESQQKKETFAERLARL